MNVGSLFAGIGGFDLGFERAGMRTIWQVEQDPYRRAVLAKHFPGARRHVDIREVHGRQTKLDDRECPDCLEEVDLICGGFPCPPVSVGGSRRGTEDERWLWPEFERIICELGPRYVVVENVPGLLERELGSVLGSLAELRYDAEWDCLPASAFGAPHTRERVWVLAYPNKDRRNLSSSREAGDEGQACAPSFPPSQLGRAKRANGERSNGASRSDHRGPVVFGRGIGQRPEGAPEPGVDRVVDRIPERVDRVAALGDSLVPQIAEWIGRRIMSWESA